MKEPMNDDERLSALLDGRLDEREREELLAHLAESDDDYEVFTATAAFLREMEEENAKAEETQPQRDVIVLRPRTKPRFAWARWGALAAAVVAGLSLLGRFLLFGGAALATPAEVVANLSSPRTPLPAGWDRNRPWDIERGAGSHASGQERRAARAGALVTDLAVSIQAPDSIQTRVLARRLKEMFDRSSSSLAAIDSGAGSSPAVLMPKLDAATRRLEEQMGKDALRLGAWAEAAYLAASRHDEAFFRDYPAGPLLDRVEKLAGDDPAAHDAARTARAALHGSGPPHWDTLTPALNHLLRAIAS